MAPNDTPARRRSGRIAGREQPNYSLSSASKVKKPKVNKTKKGTPQKKKKKMEAVSAAAELQPEIDIAESSGPQESQPIIDTVMTEVVHEAENASSLAHSQFNPAVPCSVNAAQMAGLVPYPITPSSAVSLHGALPTPEETSSSSCNGKTISEAEPVTTISDAPFFKAETQPPCSGVKNDPSTTCSGTKQDTNLEPKEVKSETQSPCLGAKGDSSTCSGVKNDPSTTCSGTKQDTQLELKEVKLETQPPCSGVMSDPSATCSGTKKDTQLELKEVKSETQSPCLEVKNDPSTTCSGTKQDTQLEPKETKSCSSTAQKDIGESSSDCKASPHSEQAGTTPAPCTGAKPKPTCSDEKVPACSGSQPAPCTGAQPKTSCSNEKAPVCSGSQPTPCTSTQPKPSCSDKKSPVCSGSQPAPCTGAQPKTSCSSEKAPVCSSTQPPPYTDAQPPAPCADKTAPTCSTSHPTLKTQDPNTSAPAPGPAPAPQRASQPSPVIKSTRAPYLSPPERSLLRGPQNGIPGLGNLSPPPPPPPPPRVEQEVSSEHLPAFGSETSSLVEIVTESETNGVGTGGPGSLVEEDARDIEMFGDDPPWTVRFNWKA